MTRRPFMAGNWKMHLTLSEATELAGEVRRLTSRSRGVDIALVPPFPYLCAVHEKIEESGIAVGAQDCDPRQFGAYTSGVSAPMLASVGCRYVLVGHSERRREFGDTDEVVNQKLLSVLGAGLVPVLCIGETKDERQSGRTKEVLDRQLSKGLQGVNAENIGGTVIAYEPVWAIGTGEVATPAMAQDAHAAIRQWIAMKLGDSVAEAIRLQYGGSVKASNVDGLMACPDIDGALVGGASLTAAEFARIVLFEK